MCLETVGSSSVTSLLSTATLDTVALHNRRYSVLGNLLDSKYLPRLERRTQNPKP